MINVISPHASQIGKALLKFGLRIYDRGLCKPLKKEREVDEEGNVIDEDEPDVNTKVVIQEELKNLYTGNQISSHYVYAQNVTYFWCVMTYSTGLPVLYIFGATFYLCLYWVQKTLLLRFYQKTIRFNEKLSIASIWYLKMGIGFHLLIGALMVTQSELLPSERSYEDEATMQ